MGGRISGVICAKYWRQAILRFLYYVWVVCAGVAMAVVMGLGEAPKAVLWVTINYCRPSAAENGGLDNAFKSGF
jgi:hypothetical protein